MNKKKRLLVTISFSFSIRYLYRTGMLNKLRDFADVVIAITWNEEQFISELKAEGFEVHVVPVSAKGVAYETARKRINFWFDFFRLKNSRRIQERYLNQFSSSKTLMLNAARRTYNYLKFFVPGYTKKIFQTERAALLADTNFNDMLQLVDKLNIDAVLSVTPFNAQEDILLRACKHRNKKMIASILSFDNITKRGWMPVIYDTYMVWNDDNKEQAYRIYKEINDEAIVHTVGAAQFDFYFNDEYLLPREEWLKLVGLPRTDKKIILYAGGPKSLFPNEPHYLQHIAEALNKGEIEGEPIVLFRCHPIDHVERWKEALPDNGSIFFDTSWTGTKNINHSNISKADVQKLCSTLAYCDVHINLCSTMTVDGSAYSKPQIGPAYDDVNPSKAHLLKSMYYQDHFVPVMNTGGLQLADSRNQMISLINNALINPAHYVEHCDNILKEIITYTDGKSTERVLNVMKAEMAAL
jgi:hypothetical protein